MHLVRFFVIFLALAVNGPLVSAIQKKVVVVPIGDSLMPIVIPQETPPEPEPEAPSLYLKDAIDKPIIWNKGWDTSIGHETKIDSSVNIRLISLSPVFGYPGIIFPANQITHWGEQKYFNSAKRIYAKAVLLVDKGNTVQGGPFEWSLNNQGFMSFHNILRNDLQTGWVGAWTDPRPGEKVWFFLISDDEKFSSNPISFTWP